MKEIIKKIIVWKLNILARLYLRKYKPVIVAVTGNVGKTSTKEVIAAVLSSVKRVRSGKGNLNNEFGVPLTIVGDWSDEYYEAGNSAWFWIKVLVVSCWLLVVGRNYPEVLVLEYGADRPGDIKRLARKFKPHVAVVTAVGAIPVHVEYFTSPEALAREKSKLLEMLGPRDYAVLNFDDQVVLDMKEKTRAKIITYGYGEGADIRISSFDFRFEDGKPIGIVFKINDRGSFIPVRINDALGKSLSWAAAAGAAVGSVMGSNFVDVSEAMRDYQPPKGRLRIIEGIKNSLIIDDTYNSSPSAMHLALETLKAIPAKRKVAVLGDMLELGKYTVEAHGEIGNLAGGVADLLITVGLRGKFIAHAAYNQMPKENIYSFPTADSAKLTVQELVQKGDLILVKGSQGVRMEKIVEEIMAEPLRKKELLVRQGKKWLNT